MNKKQRVIISSVLIISTLFFCGWLLHYFSDEEVIKRQFLSITQGLTKEGEETHLKMAKALLPVKNFLSPICEVIVVKRQYQEPLEAGLVIHYIIVYRARYSSLQVSFDELTVDVLSKSHAEVTGLVHISGHHKNLNFIDQTHRVEFALSKFKKKWRVHKAILPESLVQAQPAPQILVRGCPEGLTDRLKQWGS